MDLENKISFKSAEILLNLGCVNFSPKKQFKLTSGKFSPVYCDCRRLISFPKERKKLINYAVQKIKNSKNFKKINNIAGGESAGIPFATLIAEKLKYPMVYIRKEQKKFGRTSQIEGLIKKNDIVLLVEDLMTDGGSKVRFLEAVEKVNAETKLIFVIFNYGIKNKFFDFKRKKIDLICLTNWATLLKVGIIKKLINKSDLEIIQEFLFSIGVKS